MFKNILFIKKKLIAITKEVYENIYKEYGKISIDLSQKGCFYRCKGSINPSRGMMWRPRNYGRYRPLDTSIYKCIAFYVCPARALPKRIFLFECNKK